MKRGEEEEEKGGEKRTGGWGEAVLTTKVQKQFVLNYILQFTSKFGTCKYEKEESHCSLKHMRLSNSISIMLKVA